MESSLISFGQKGERLVFFHGWQQDKHSFAPLVPFLHQKFRLFLIDLPGFGNTPLPKRGLSFENYVQLVAKSLVKQNLSPVTLIGHSFGGKIAATLAATQPKLVKKQILIAPSGIPTPKRWYFAFPFIPKGLKKSLLPLTRRFFGSRDYQKAGKLLPLFKSVVKTDSRSIFQKIQKPTLIIWGKNDQELPLKHAKIIRQLIKNSQLKILPGDHFVFQKSPQKVAKIIANFC